MRAHRLLVVTGVVIASASTIAAPPSMTAEPPTHPRRPSPQSPTQRLSGRGGHRVEDLGPSLRLDFGEHRHPEVRLQTRSPRPRMRSGAGTPGHPRRERQEARPADGSTRRHRCAAPPHPVTRAGPGAPAPTSSADRARPTTRSARRRPSARSPIRCSTDPIPTSTPTTRSDPSASRSSRTSPTRAITTPRRVHTCVSSRHARAAGPPGQAQS